MTSSTNRQESLLRLALPVLAAAALLSSWQAWVTYFDVPTYLVPSPWLIGQTLVADWALLGAALLVTLKITLLAFGASIVIGSLIAFV
ncbi:MAG: ABC transporter permease, partial [Massilia sp.]|nr:ABC transporter permease [Aquabacterium sp.]